MASIKSPYPLPQLPSKVANFGQQVLDACEQIGDRVAFIEDESGLQATGTEFSDLIKESVLVLQELGLSHGRLLGIFGPPAIQSSAVLIAGMICNAIAAGVRPTQSYDEFATICKQRQMNFLVVDPKGHEWAERLSLELPCLQKVLVLGDKLASGGDKIVSYPEMRAIISRSGAIFNRAEDVDADQIAYLTETTGTTGPPKGVKHTHLEATINNGLIKRKPECSIFHLTPEDVNFIVTPFSHASSLLILFPSIFGGAKVIFIPLHKIMGLEPFVKKMNQYGTSVLFLAPNLGAALLQSNLTAADLPKVRFAIGLSANKIMGAKLAAKFGWDVELVIAQSENGGYYAVDYGHPKKAVVHERDSNLRSGVEVMVVDLETGKSLGPKQRGEIYTRGPHLAKGYYLNPEATAKAFDADGWFRTEDYGFYDDNGKLFLLDKIKHCARLPSGRLVSCQIFEDALFCHPSVLNVAVVPIPISTSAQIPVACVEVLPGSNVNVAPQALKEFANEFVDETNLEARVEELRVIIVDHIPMASNGRPLKSVLTEMVRKQVTAEQ